MTLWDIRRDHWQRQFTPIATLVGHADCVKKIAFSPDGSYLASASVGGAIFLWAKISTASSGKEKWVMIDRHYDSFTLDASNAFLQGAEISESNLRLLKYRGANVDQVPDYEKNLYKFWSQAPSIRVTSTREPTETSFFSP